jgi:CTP:molybdopterin cytidylyltransferase MocA
MSAAAVILAAGSGRRFNQGESGTRPGDKLLSVVRGRALVNWAIVPALEAGFDEVVVVGGAVDLRSVVPESVTVLQNDRWPNGQATSLRVALEWCGSRGHVSAVIGLGDMPGLTARAWRAVADAPLGPVVFATYQGRRAHPVRLDAEIWSMLPSDGDEGARALVRQRPDLAHDVACDGVPSDIDTPDDLQRWRRDHGTD